MVHTILSIMLGSARVEQVFFHVDRQFLLKDSRQMKSDASNRVEKWLLTAHRQDCTRG